MFSSWSQYFLNAFSVFLMLFHCFAQWFPVFFPKFSSCFPCFPVVFSLFSRRFQGHLPSFPHAAQVGDFFRGYDWELKGALRGALGDGLRNCNCVDYIKNMYSYVWYVICILYILICIHIYIYIHTYIHTYTYVYRPPVLGLTYINGITMN